MGTRRTAGRARWTAMSGAALLGATLAITGSATGAAADDCVQEEGDLTRVVGDWDGDGDDTPGVVDRNGHWQLRNSNTGGNGDICFSYGDPWNMGDHLLVGDWNGDGTDTPGLARPINGQWQWRLRNSNTTGVANIVLTFGDTLSNAPVVGDWDANGTTTIGSVQDVVSGKLRWRLRNSNTTGAADRIFDFGNGSTPNGGILLPFSGDWPVVGDWDGTGTDTAGTVAWSASGKLWSIRNNNTTGPAAATFVYGTTSDFAIPGDWDGDGTTTPGVTRRLPHSTVGNLQYLSIRWLLRNSNSAGAANLQFTYGRESTVIPA